MTGSERYGGLSGRVAVVTGGTGGVGLATARRLCTAGCHVTLNYAHHEADAERAVKELSGLAGTVQAARCDVAAPGEAPRLLTDVHERHGRLDIVIHTAATLHRMPALRPEIGDFWDDLRLTINPLLQSASTLAELLEPGTGRVVAMSSSGARSVVPHYLSQGVAKAALESLVRYLAVELAPRGVTVNAVATARLDRPGMAEPELSRMLAARTPGGRLTRPTDVADVIALLCGDDAAWIQGQTITTDGGLGLRA